MELKTVGWIGTGVMGKSMCGHLMKAGYAANVYNRTPEKAADLVAAGARLCATPAEVAANSDVVFTIVGFPTDVEQVYFGPEGIISNARKGTVVVDMTTSKPALAQAIAAEAQAHGVEALDAPVSGGDLGARNATLAIMVGGSQAVYEKVLPFFNAMGKTIQLMGPAGAGQHTKMCNQILIAGTMIGVVESLLYAARAGMDHDAVIDIIGSGAASSWSINNLGRRIAKGDYDPGFYIKHFVKDMGIALEEARAMKLALPGLALVHQLYVAAQGQGLENLGTQGLYKACLTVNGLQ
ncbi:NAD(P)-dependent oxidoreductase [Desulfovibrio subterraneus]|jgi:3-hydroxyisobutyrate dehydrogenase|uniref:3-hydroxyisobutyrate dehydrogenase n=1 Tax=Desulfovibrio subterraneus TaxID=2718620 RepID=A0A7J0BGB3_9BACT|nr:NAD(P)-dependent oxidoreductase [Desulfovibrio subterraneus]GFM32241.1 3-hydroxyisobutyrate dehydrogenase [Desulfovibrio subterraneus]